MIRGGVLALAVLAVAAAPATAQTQPVDDGTTVGGQVPSSLELILTPRSGFSKFKRAGAFTLKFHTMVTTTENVAVLSLADGDAASGSKLGHLSAGAKRLPDALEARAGRSAFQPLDKALDALLMHWSGPITRKAATVTLRQKVRTKSSATYRKTLLVTASSETP